MALWSSDYRDMITHLATYFGPDLHQKHIDYVFQYKWESEFEKGTIHLKTLLQDMNQAYKTLGDSGIVSMYGSGTRDPLKEGSSPITPLRYWKV